MLTWLIKYGIYEDFTLHPSLTKRWCNSWDFFNKLHVPSSVSPVTISDGSRQIYILKREDDLIINRQPSGRFIPNNVPLEAVTDDR